MNTFKLDVPPYKFSSKDRHPLGSEESVEDRWFVKKKNAGKVLKIDYSGRDQVRYISFVSSI